MDGDDGSELNSSMEELPDPEQEEGAEDPTREMPPIPEVEEFMESPTAAVPEEPSATLMAAASLAPEGEGSTMALPERGSTVPSADAPRSSRNMVKEESDDDCEFLGFTNLDDLSAEELQRRFEETSEKLRKARQLYCTWFTIVIFSHA